MKVNHPPVRHPSSADTAHIISADPPPPFRVADEADAIGETAGSRPGSRMSNLPDGKPRTGLAGFEQQIPSFLRFPLLRASYAFGATLTK